MKTPKTPTNVNGKIGWSLLSLIGVPIRCGSFSFYCAAASELEQKLDAMLRR